MEMPPFLSSNQEFSDYVKQFDFNDLKLINEFKSALFYYGDKIDEIMASLLKDKSMLDSNFHMLGNFLSSFCLIVGFTSDYSILLSRIQKLYIIICEEQINNAKAIHKGRELYNEGLINYHHGKKQLGIRLITLALIEDILHGDVKIAKTSLAYRFLASNVYNEYTANYICERLTNRISKMHNDIMFPEEVLNAEDHIEVIPGFASEYFIYNPVQYKLLLNQLQKNDDKTGRNLEVLIQHLFSSIIGLQFMTDRLRTSSSELDLIYRIPDSNHPLFEAFGHYIIIECKDWSKPIGAAVIRSYVGELQSLSVRGGIIVSREGITGSSSEEFINARLEIAKAYHRHGVTIPVLDLNDLKLIDDGFNLITILYKKYEEVRFDL
jgi:hypothetical protein